MSNILVIGDSGCKNDTCTEPTKKRFGFSTNVLSPEQLEKGISRHVNHYDCNCRATCEKQK